MKLGVLFNCQAEGVAGALRALRPGDDVVHFSYPHLVGSPPALAEAAAVLQTCDLVIASETPFGLGPASPAELRRKGVHVAAIPPILFGGFHPDICFPGPGTADGGGAFHGPTGLCHSRISLAGFLADLSVENTAALYNRLVFSRLGYFNQFGEDRALLVARFRDVAGYNLNPWFDAWVRSGCFMHSFNHPKVHVLADLARIACELLGLPAAEVPPQTIQSDRLALLAAHPVYPDLAAYFGVPANPLFQLPMQGSVGRSSVSLEAYLALCFRDYRSVRRRKLLGVEGMPATLAALGLDT
jgi:hypothetical protein